MQKGKDHAKDKKAEDREREVVKLFQMKTVKPGDAVNFPNQGDSISIDYVAYLEDGTCFDSSRGRGQPLNFVLGAGQIIPGIEMVLPLMSRGTGVRIVVPPEYGYGEKGYPPIIPPKATLLFEVELLSFSSLGSAERMLREKRKEDPYAL